MVRKSPDGTRICGAAGRWRGLAVLLVAGFLLSVTACGAASSGASAAQATAARVTAGATATPRGMPKVVSAATATFTPPQETWIPVASQSPADVLAAVRQAPFVQLVSSAPGSSDGYTDLSHLGTPVLVLAYGPQSPYSRQPSRDYFEIPVLSSSGFVTGTINAQLNVNHTAIYVGSISGGGWGTATHWPGGLVDASQAAEITQTQLHVGLRAGTQPQLIYLAAYDTAGVGTGQVAWSAGGGGPMNPIWRVPGADGHDYFVGTDGHAYTLAQLPVQKQG